MKKSILFYSMLIMGSIFFIACGGDDEPKLAELEISGITATVGDVTRTGVVDATALTVSFQPFLPRTEIDAVTISVTLPEGVTVTPASGTAQDFSNGSVAYTITNGSESLTFDVTVTAEFAASIAFVGDANGSGSIADPDMKAAYAALSAEFGDDLIYMPFSSINSDALAYIEVVVIYSDTNTGNNPGILDAIPASGRSASVVSAFKAWHVAGGNFVLAGQGTQYLNQLGRIPADGSNEYQDNRYAPRIFGSGDGFDNADQWNINANLNPNPIETVSTSNWDRTGHAIYAGLTASNVSNPTTDPVGTYGVEGFPLVGSGYKEDHNSMWDINALRGINSTYEVMDAYQLADQFEADLECSILATWGHVVDLCCGAVLEMHARSATPSEGSIIAIGAAAYEWEQNGEANPFVGNVESLTVNSVNYLLSK